MCVCVFVCVCSTDILNGVRRKKEQGETYVMVFVGVNGVGKSTNLAKMAYWLRAQDLSVMVAACDTFRSGAVEQLQTHCQRLQIPLFTKGYAKDPAQVKGLVRGRENIHHTHM